MHVINTRSKRGWAGSEASSYHDMNKNIFLILQRLSELSGRIQSLDISLNILEAKVSDSDQTW